jgi:uncharacterized membrane protein
MSEAKPPESSSSQLPVATIQPQKESPKSLEQIIQEKAPEVLKDIPGEKRQVLAQVKIEEHRFEMRASPLPDPAELAAYNQIIPNGADRILKMAEQQSAHRISIEKIVITGQQSQAFIGQLFGLIIGLSGLGMATYAAIIGQPWFGSVIGGATLVSLVSAFLYSRQNQKRELSQKQQQVQMQIPKPPQGAQKQKHKNKHRR